MLPCTGRVIPFFKGERVVLPAKGGAKAGGSRESAGDPVGANACGGPGAVLRPFVVGRKASEGIDGEREACGGFGRE